MKIRTLLLVVFSLGIFCSAGFSEENKLGVYKPLKIYQTIDPVFPNYLVAQKRTGMARIAIMIDKEGKLAGHLVVAYTKQAFAEAAMEAIRAWRFDPATLDGIAIPCVTELTFDFEATGVVVNLDFQGAVESFYAIAHQRVVYDYKISTMKEIDRIPLPKSVVSPNYPQVLSSTSDVLKVSVNFFIDESGSVRLPSIVAADDYRLGELAIQAINQWKFEPPTRGGKPVMVKATQVFYFEPSKKPKTNG